MPIQRFLVILAILILAPLATSTAQLLPPDDVTHLTVTSEQLAPEFWRLAALRQDEGMTARVVTLEWIESYVPAGVDPAATLRDFVSAAHDQWGVEFLLLGGDQTVVPVRIVRSEFYPYDGFTDIACDLYFAGLDGDWNADGDEIWGEPYVNETDPGDAADLEPDLSVGRAPVATVAEAARFVDGVIAADQNAAQQIDELLLMAEVWFPVDWNPGDPIISDGAEFAIALEDLVMQATSPPTVTRMFESDTYPHDLPLDRDHALAALGSGDFGLVMPISHGGLDAFSVGADVVTGEDVHQLGNAPDYFVLTSFSGVAAAFHLGGWFRDALVAPDGGAVAAVGWSAEVFPATQADYVTRLVELLYLDGPQRLGPAVDDMRLLNIDQTARETVDRWTVLTLLLLGDPAQRMGPVPDWSDDVTASQGPPRGIQLAPPAPNPFNPTTVLHFELPAGGPVELAIYTLDGRRVVVLLDETRAAGSHEAVWRGADDAGRPLPSGSYLARLSAGGTTAVRRLQLVR
jgi:hypothetical protein